MNVTSLGTTLTLYYIELLMPRSTPGSEVVNLLVKIRSTGRRGPTPTPILIDTHMLSDVKIRFASKNVPRMGASYPTCYRYACA